MGVFTVQQRHFVVQVFPRLLELGPVHFKAALHRLMMPLPSSGMPFQLAYALPT